MLFEKSVKIGNAVEVDSIADLFDGIIGRLQHRISIFQFLFVKIIGNSFACLFFESAANIRMTVRKTVD